MAENLELYADLISEPCRSVVIYCKLSGIAYNFHSIDLIKGEFLSPEFTEINPFQEVPAIVHGDFKLNQSPAIVKYLADAYNIDNPWYPKDIKVRARIDAFLHWHHQNIREKKDEYLLPMIVLPMISDAKAPEGEVEAKLREKAMEAVKNFDWILEATGYAARTERATIADVFAFSELEMLKLVGIDANEFPRIKKWRDEIGAIQEVQEAHEILYAMIANPPQKNN
ncbi:hypothetical protein SteCoe_1285 [Stentor coeruleus]|uniref:Glutathione transferase n=1 Tax=Stentor coeruleus TaxID=5963 RepID=A0A1R2D288_9CILI|nr:hypothetical protein SteCoe_1285 [Stentor coeruleus]